MKREVCFLIGADEKVLWSDASDSPLALPDSRDRWEAIWSRRAELVEIAHSHPLGPEAFSAEDVSTMHALDDALGKKVRFSLVTPTQYLVRAAADAATPSTAPKWVRALRIASGLVLSVRLSDWAAAGPTGDAKHRAQLQELVDALTPNSKVLFVCTHNSRRSQIAQLLAWAAVRSFGLKKLQTFSGGTEVTAFDARAVEALRRAGLSIQSPLDSARGERGAYLVEDSITAFSKLIDDPENPSSDFVAVMTCSQADAACPVVKGATRRVSVPYEDPKAFDGTAEEAQRYDERVEQMGRDLVWVFKLLAQKA